MNFPRPILTLTLVSLLVIGHWSLVISQGPLTPPGAPAPTMKTLDEVEPRIPITTLPFIISQGGSYYLTKSFVQDFPTSGTQAALSILTHDVTLDFRGFTIQQTGTDALSGIRMIVSTGDAALRNVVIRNGTITGFASGIFCLGGRGCLIENMTIRNSAAGGITFQGLGAVGAANNTFRRCRTHDNGGTGILVAAGAANIGNVIEQCESRSNLTGFSLAGGGNLIVGCRASANTGNNYAIQPGNRMGLIVLPGTNAAAINGSSGATGTGTSDPFANLSY